MSVLPPLREELDLLPGPSQPDGQPTWTLHDPIRNLYFQLDWVSVEILKRWGLGDLELIATAVNKETLLPIDADAVQKLRGFLEDNELLAPGTGRARAFADKCAARRGTWASWLLHNYLFFRIPLIKPDRWLSRTVDLVGFFYTRQFLRMTLVVGGLGLISVYREWDRFSTTLVDLMSWQGFGAYGITLIGVKVLHELGHAYTAKRYGCRVPTMGVAFLVLWPVAYTDTNDVWRLTQRRHRIAVASAGILTELTIAVWATLAWAWLPEGHLKSAAFLLSTTTWISTLLINASPFMRFDGYFLLADWLQLPNLHSRAFNLARWDLRERLFGLGVPRPELFPPARHVGLIVFAWATWLYRLVLFIGIAVLVYQYFFKALGIFLFMVEISWFIARPLRNELRVWRTAWPHIRATRRSRRTLAWTLFIFSLFILPWPTAVTGSGMLMPASEQVIYAPPHAQVESLSLKNGADVVDNALIIRFHSPDLQARMHHADSRRESLAWQSASAGFDETLRKEWLTLTDQFSLAVAEAATVTVDLGRYTPTAIIPGKLRDLDPDLGTGEWLSQREVIGRVVNPDQQQVVTYVDDENIGRITLGDSGVFLADGGMGPSVRLTVKSIDKDTSRILLEPELAHLFGGHVLVRERGGSLYTERAVYRVVLQVSSSVPDNSQHRWRGRVAISGSWEAPGYRVIRGVAATLWREVGF